MTLKVSQLNHRLAVKFAVLSLIIVGCDINTYVPSAEVIRNPRNPSSALIYKETNIRGIYGNMDVDSEIYSYQTLCVHEQEFWTAIDQAAIANNWRPIRNVKLASNQRRFLRIRHRTREEVYHSVEEARIAFNRVNKTVIVARVQSDQRQLPLRFPTDGPDGEFATSVIWRRFTAEVARANGS